MTRYTKTMAQAYKEVSEKAKVKEQENDPVQKAQDKLDKAKQIAQLKKQIDTIKKDGTQSEAIDPAGDDDHEVSMARGELEAIADKALELSSAMKDMPETGNPLEAWVQSKITKAKDYINSAYDYLMYNPDIAMEDMDMDPAKHVARSKRNPDKFCVFDKDGNEVKLFDKKADAIAYAKANHDKLMEELEYVVEQLIKAKTPQEKIKTLDKMDKLKSKAKRVMNDKDKAKKMANDLNNLAEFTDSQIKRLKKEYEPFRGKDRVSPEKFNKLRGIMKRFTKAQLMKVAKADIPILSSGAKASLVLNHGMKYAQIPEEMVPYIDDLQEEQKSKFKSVDPKVLTRVSKMMRGSKEEKQALANLMNYLMPPEVVDMIRDKFGIKMPRGKIKFTDL